MRDATIYQVAEKAGVSVSTVSRVLNGFLNVKDETREKVLKVMKDCNFYPDYNARGLAKKSTKLIGILIGDIRANQYSNGVYFIVQEFSKNGYSCVIFNTGMDPKQQVDNLMELVKRKVEAVVLVGSTFQNKTIQKLIPKKLPTIPVIICNGQLKGKNVYSVVSNEKQGFQEIAKFLSVKGHSSFAYITKSKHIEEDLKACGFLEGFRKYVSEGEIHFKFNVFNSEEIVAAVNELLDKNKKIDSLVVYDDFAAFVALHVLVQRGIKVPQQIAVVGVNNSRYAEFSNPSLTSLNNMLIDLCLIAARNIIDVLKGNTVNNLIQIMPNLVERSST